MGYCDCDGIFGTISIYTKWWAPVIGLISCIPVMAFLPSSNATENTQQTSIRNRWFPTSSPAIWLETCELPVLETRVPALPRLTRPLWSHRVPTSHHMGSTLKECVWSLKLRQQPEEKTTARMTPVCWLSDLCQQRRAKTARYQCMSVRMTHGPLCIGWHRGTATSVGRFLCLTQPLDQVGSREQRQSSTPSMGGSVFWQWRNGYEAIKPSTFYR